MNSLNPRYPCRLESAIAHTFEQNDIQEIIVIIKKMKSENTTIYIFIRQVHAIINIKSKFSRNVDRTKSYVSYIA